jgi:hypothetical protein
VCPLSRPESDGSDVFFLGRRRHLFVFLVGVLLLLLLLLERLLFNFTISYV